MFETHEVRQPEEHVVRNQIQIFEPENASEEEYGDQKKNRLVMDR
jgi:hypothetical protein